VRVEDVITLDGTGKNILHHSIEAAKNDSSHIHTLLEVLTHVQWHQAQQHARCGSKAYSLANVLTGPEAHPPNYAPIHQACTNSHACAREMV
jgi:hypothetical protein